MTDQELDLLASSFLDGEATPDEVAMIERDPALLARVEELRVAQSAMRAPVPRPSMQVKEDQLAAALAAFDAADQRTTVMAVDGAAETTAEATSEATSDAAAEPTEGAGPVIDLRAHRIRREQREAEAAGRMRWLSAAAGVLVFAAGAVFLISQTNNGGDDGEFAGDVPAAETAATESAEAQMAPAGDGGADVSADSELSTDAAIDSEAMDADAEEDFAVEEAEAAAADEAVSAADAGSEPAIREFAEEGFFGDEPVATYQAVPTSDELLADLDLPWRTPESAMCAGRAELPDNAEIIGYLPIEIPAAGDGTDSATRVVEALYLTVGGESQVVLVDTDTCAVI
ncbi:MAG: hypothetical protein OES24_09515 [Acidimicrobiia bacterium]|nr:hypothetical protein [Acidimicrobiia bacterium]